MKVYRKLFDEIINIENLFSAWEEFKVGKTKKIDVMRFEESLEQNIFKLQRELENRAYRHGSYTDFHIFDPKKRHIHKASVIDRVLHHAVFQVLNKVFEPTFISNSFSCRIGKGNHKGVYQAEKMIRKVSRNYTKPCYILKCDVKKFFDTIDHSVLLSVLKRKIKDKNTIWLLEEIIGSFVSQYSDLFSKKGVPIGNLTSQLFANTYMNEFDQFVKKTLKIKSYARYTDDFIVVSGDRDYLKKVLGPIQEFLRERLKLKLHPDKIEIFKSSEGVDFLGYVMFPHHRLVRKKTRKRVFRKTREKIGMYKNGLVSEKNVEGTLNSFLGVLSHANTFRLSEELRNKYWLWLNE